MSEELKTYILDERKFLHEISNQLVIAMGMGDYVQGVLKENTSIDEKCSQKMQKTMRAVEKITNMVLERRDKIKSMST
ncbi:MAG: hypothetical protein KAQ98_00515 [Bacteriovoracaceae bacterium]|nr:hypothetical protein [Bacteriovoracaceae bacterium]